MAKLKNEPGGAPLGESQASPFVYFDLGNVLLAFDHRRACRQMAAVAGLSADIVWDIVFAGDLELRYERGDLSTNEFYEIFCRRSGAACDQRRLLEAASDIFEVNHEAVALVDRLRRRNTPLGILSNTCEAHWSHVLRRHAGVAERFSVHALSFQLRSVKPEPEIYLRAAQLAARPVASLFFIDDRPENVAAATAAGFDAVVFTTAEQLEADLQRRKLLSGDAD